MVKYLFMLVALMLPLAGQAKECGVDYAKPQSILEGMKTCGGRAVVADASKRHKSGAIGEAIATGTDDWLAVAKNIAPYADASLSEALPVDVSLALTKNPEAVLRLSQEKNSLFPISDICTVMLIEPTKAQYDAHVHAVDNALAKATAPDIQQAKSQCLKQIHARSWESEWGADAQK